jgi:hypothetical protein
VKGWPMHRHCCNMVAANALCSYAPVAQGIEQRISNSKFTCVQYARHPRTVANPGESRPAPFRRTTRAIPANRVRNNSVDNTSAATPAIGTIAGTFAENCGRITRRDCLRPARRKASAATTRAGATDRLGAPSRESVQNSRRANRPTGANVMARPGAPCRADVYQPPPARCAGVPT